MDLTVNNIATLRIGGVEIWITETMRNSWIISAALVLIAIIVRIKLKNFRDIPRGFQNAIEAIVEIFDRFVRESAGERLASLGNWFFMVFCFILISNISGLFLMRPPTADWTVTFAFALVTLIIIHYHAFKNKRMEHIKGLFKPIFLFFPINIIGELARPISLSFRLYGNVFSGMVLITLIYSLAPPFALFGFPLVLHGFFDIFAGVLQTYVFCIVSLSLIGVLSAPEEA